jgi:predicted nucleotidyltransferase
MTKDQLIEFAKQELTELFEEHKSNGILAIYIWGSITRPDFDLNTSDIDVICIVSNDFPLEVNEQLRDELSHAAPEREWGFQIIYLDELNGGPLRSRLAKAMSPQSILPTFDAWVFVCGRHFQRTDFSVKNATIPERMKLNIEEIKRRLAAIPTDDDYKKIRDRKGVIKAALLLVYNRQLNRGETFALDYNDLQNHADSTETSILATLLKVKREGLYDEDSFSTYAPAIESFALLTEREFS